MSTKYEALTPTTSANPAVELDNWAKAWPQLREDVTALAANYAEKHGMSDSSRVTLLVDELDSVLRLLIHRVTWMQEHNVELALER